MICFMIHFILTFLCVFVCVYLATRLAFAVCMVVGNEEPDWSLAKTLKLCLTWPVAYWRVYNELKCKSNENDEI
jgi:hypothetical protein